MWEGPGWLARTAGRWELGWVWWEHWGGLPARWAQGSQRPFLQTRGAARPVVTRWSHGITSVISSGRSTSTGGHDRAASHKTSDRSLSRPDVKPTSVLLMTR